MALLEVDSIFAGYGRIQAIRDIAFSIDEGEAVALVGSNGAGKSTTLRAISGIIRPNKGEVRFKGCDVTGFPSHVLVKMGMAHVPEGRQVFTRLTVLENLEMGAFLERDKARYKKNLDRVFSLFPILAERQAQNAGTLSGGEQQMLAIGRAMLSDPRILLLDEPSMGLAPKLVNQIFEVIKEINDAGATVLLVEQNANLALATADRGIVVESGSIVLQGLASDLLRNDMVRKVYLGEEEHGDRGGAG